GPVDRRQHFPQNRDGVVRGRSPVVRPARQAGEVPGRRLPDLRRPGRLCPPGPAAVSARGLGRRRRPPREVPRAQGVVFQEKWRIAMDLLEQGRKGLPHGWVVGDDEFGRPAHFRAWLRREDERYVLDVPSDTIVRDLQCRRPPGRRADRGTRRKVPCRRVDVWAARQPEGRWTRLTIRDGERGPLWVDAMTVRVRTKVDRKNGPEERLV